MAMIAKSKQQFDPEDNLSVPGTYHAICSGIRQGVENKSYPDGKPLIVIEFTVAGGSGAASGKKCAIVCGESLYRSEKTGKKSRFLTHCEEMGCYRPEEGVDPDTFLDRHYTVTVIDTNGKYYVSVAVPFVPPAGGTNGKPKGKPALAPPAPAKDDTVPF